MQVLVFGGRGGKSGGWGHALLTKPFLLTLQMNLLDIIVVSLQLAELLESDLPAPHWQAEFLGKSLKGMRESNSCFPADFK